MAASLVVLIYVAGIRIGYLLERNAGLPDAHALEEIVLQCVLGAFAVVGSLLVAKRPANLIRWIMATVALIVGLFPTSQNASQLWVPG